MVFLREATVWSHSILELEVTSFIVQPQPLPPLFKEKKDTEASRGVTGSQASRSLQRVTAQVVPSSVPHATSLQPRLDLLSLSLSASQQPELLPHLSSEPLLCFSGHIEGGAWEGKGCVCLGRYSEARSRKEKAIVIAFPT